ncbi:fimbrial biogenesis usher protein [Buttiauxella sp. B2]|uniref:fimbrial biogenesis usher protein n=1 Tax=Buttiauxella sp. B2 TaxID=2587812 RepID=UPI001CB8BBEF|nr:fimbrial biogenesis usher protein [Buttiauxella sp. B2]
MKKQYFKFASLAIAIASANGYAEEYFNPAFLSGDPSAVADLSRFEGGTQAPGTYRVDVYLNEIFQSRKDIQFLAASAHPGASADDIGLTPCLTPAMLIAMGVNIEGQPKLTKTAADKCLDIATAIEGASAQLNFEQLRLDISVPQAMMRNSARGYIPPSQWDEGINALLLNYNFSGSNSVERHSGSSKDYFLGLNSGLNLGPWRLRDDSTWSYNNSGKHSRNDWQHINTLLERAIIPLRAELVMGDSTTPSEVFDSLGFRGVQLASDDNMLPDSLRGFAPTIRGIARSHARVTIRQNGYTIYQSYVPPGAFEINDLFPTSSSGDLVVEVKETDGSINVYTVPYASVPVLQREGHIKYAVTAGKYRSNSDRQSDVNFAQSTLIWGLPAGFTAYGGTQLAENYNAFALGMGVNIGTFGALSLDVTQANSTLADDSQHSGASLRFLYGKSLNSTGTHFQLIGYRYSTEGFYTLEESTWKQMSGYVHSSQDDTSQPSVIDDYYNLHNNKRDKIQINISQQLGKSGSIYINGSRQSYWQTGEVNSLLQTGYSGNLYDISWTLNYSYNKIPGLKDADNRVALGISIPLSHWLAPAGDVTQQQHNAFATYSISNDTRGHTTQNAGISGTLLEDDNLNYNLQQGYQNQSGGASGSAGLDYDGSWGSASAGYNYSDNGDYQQVNYGLSGSIVAHRNGVTLSQPLGETNVLIAAPGASGVKVEDNAGLRTDWRGYAIVPYATTYRRNRMALDTTSLPDNVDLNDTVVNVVPTRGALVRASFDAHVGARVLLSLTHNGKVVPFGAMVTSAEENSSIVGDDGQVYLSGLPLKGKLAVRWGEGDARQCVVNYRLPDDAASKAINKLTRVCQ